MTVPDLNGIDLFLSLSIYIYRWIDIHTKVSGTDIVVDNMGIGSISIFLKPPASP